MSRASLVAKHVTDVTVSAFAFVALAPVIGATALAVWASMGSPVLFRQLRVGLGGASFTLYKFRTMREFRDPEGRLLPDEARATPVGQFLRRLRLDELPQLWNVLEGQMSLIGPRPLLRAEVDVMGEDGRERAGVRPGITGWAQVHGGDLLGHERHDVRGIKAKLALDLWYVRHATLRIDLQVLLLTARMIIFGERVDWKAIEKARAALASR